MWGVSGEYALNEMFTLLAIYNGYGYDSTHYNYSALGFTYHHGNGLNAGLRYNIYHEPNALPPTISVHFGYDFGGGVTFGTRDWSGVMPGW